MKNAQPNEGVAFLFENDTIVEEVVPTERSPTHFEAIDAEIINILVDKYGNPSSLFHTHPAGTHPSLRDLNHMVATTIAWGSIPWLIMSRDGSIEGWKLLIDKNNRFSLKKVDVKIT